MLALYRDANHAVNSSTLMQIEEAVTLLKSLENRPAFLGFLGNGAGQRFLKENITYSVEDASDTYVEYWYHL